MHCEWIDGAFWLWHNKDSSLAASSVLTLIQRQLSSIVIGTSYPNLGYVSVSVSLSLPL